MIVLDNVSLAYPLLDIRSHSFQVALRKKVSALIGGHIDTSSKIPYVNALNNISLTIKEGQRLGILGHNGSGKTTLLRLIAGIYTPTQGKISVQGKISSLTDFTLGMDPDVSGLKNIIFRLVFMGLTMTQAKAAIDDIVDFSGLAEFIHLPVRTYSTGMFLRLAFAISTYVPPDILVLDEIIGAGDEGFKAKMLGRLEQLLIQSRIVVLSSHDLPAIQRYCTDVALLDKGTLIAQGKPQEILEIYHNQQKR